MKRLVYAIAVGVVFAVVAVSVMTALMMLNTASVSAMIPKPADRQSRAVASEKEVYFFDAGVSDNRQEFPRVDIARGMTNVAVLPTVKGAETMYEFLDPGQAVVVQGYVQIVLNKASVQTNPPLPTGRFGKGLWRVQADGLEIWQGYVSIPTEITAW